MVTGVAQVLGHPLLCEFQAGLGQMGLRPGKDTSHLSLIIQETEEFSFQGLEDKDSSQDLMTFP